MQASDNQPESETPPNSLQPDKPRQRWSKTPSNYPLPSDRHNFSSHFEVLRRFMTVTGNGARAVPAPDVEGGSVPTQAAQLNTGFFVDLGLLEEPSRGNFRPTSDAIRFLTLRTAGEERARPIIRALVEKSWFGKAAVTVFATKSFVSEEELVADLGAAAGTDLTKKEKSIRVIVEYLKLAGVVVKTPQGLGLASGDALLHPPPAEPGMLPPPTDRGPFLPAPAFDAAAMTWAPTVPPTNTVASAGVSGAPAAWETVQRNEFYLRVRRTQAAIDQVKRIVEMLQAELDSGKADVAEKPGLKPAVEGAEAGK